jgi:hypothetical protein
MTSAMLQIRRPATYSSVETAGRDLLARLKLNRLARLKLKQSAMDNAVM